MATKKKIRTIRLEPGSPLGEGLKKMLIHKKLREKFLLLEISFDELNKLMRENDINKQYDHPGDV